MRGGERRQPVVDEDGAPVPREPYELVLPDGAKRHGFLDERGFARVDGIPGGVCEVSFPRRHAEEWRKA